MGEPMADLSRKVAPYDPQMARDAMHHYDAMYCDLIEMAEEMEERADGLRERATDAKLRAENLRDRLVEDGHLPAQRDGPGGGE